MVILLFCFIGTGCVFAWDNINIAINHPQNAPYFIGLPEMNIDAEEFSTVLLKIKSSQSGTARLFWASSYDPQMNEPKNIWFYLDKSTESKEYVFNIKSQNPHWLGFIGQILIYPENGAEGIQIESARAIPGNLFTNIKSGWREFWGPRGRAVIGSTINVIPASSIFGRPINLYVYWITGLFFFCSLIYWSFQLILRQKKKDYALVSGIFKRSAKESFILIIVFWAFLALNTDINYFNIFKNDFIYTGKSIEQKRSIAYGPDYYEFLSFAKRELPATPVKFAVLSTRYAPELQARIYLAPHVLTAEADYLLLFYPDAGQIKITSGFKETAKLNANAYLMQRIKKNANH